MQYRLLPIVMAAADNRHKAVQMYAKLIAKTDSCAVRMDIIVQITGTGMHVKDTEHVSLCAEAATIITEDIIDRQKPSC